MSPTVRMLLAVPVLSALGIPSTWANSGSWMAELPGMRLAIPSKSYLSHPAVPPREDIARRGSVRRVAWRFELPPGRDVRAWLCESRRCIELHTRFGTSSALDHSSAQGPFHFRFELAEGEPRALEVRGLELLVDYSLSRTRASTWALSPE